MMLILILIFLPLLGGIAAFFAGRKAPVVAIATMGLGAVLSLQLWFLEAAVSSQWTWLPGFPLGWYIDRLSSLLIGLVYLISLLVHLFSLHYMKSDKGISRYFFKLGFFTTCMLGLLAADHFILIFIFWELVGFSSFLLIGFWYTDPANARAAREAFMINRVADAALLVGVILMLRLDQLYISRLEAVPETLLNTVTGCCLLAGALGKSAQFPFSGWLPKAMAGPTPVSALIHAATMVAAGVYLLIRVLPFLTPMVLNATAVIGAVTAFLAAFAALRQHDIKKVLAYSTISQLGFMIMGIGAGAFQASLFHLWTHAFFKAGLFLAAGSVITYFHRLHENNHQFDAQDMRNMGGIRKVLPVSFGVFLLCGLALSGLPFFSGFLSKEGILAGSWLWADHLAEQGFRIAFLVPDLAFLAAFLTPVYIGRQILLVFYGNPRSQIKILGGMEPVLSVRIPLIILAAGSLWFLHSLNPLTASGWWFRPYLFSFDEGLVSSFEDKSIRLYTLILSIVLTLGGLAIAYLTYGRKDTTSYLHANTPHSWYWKISYHGWYMDSFYGSFSKGYFALCNLSNTLDRTIDKGVDTLGVSVVVLSKLLAIIDREVVDGLVTFIAWISRGVGRIFSQVQSARVQSQVAWMAVALALLIFWLQF